MIWLDSVFFSGELLRSTYRTANMTWLNSGVYWCMWFVEAAIWYGYCLCYNSGLVMCTAKEVAYLFTWRLFNILVLHLTWLDETGLSYVKCILNFFRDALHPWKQCIAKGCISVYWPVCKWYDWTRFNSAKLLSNTCSTANISVAMVDSSPLKLMHKIFKDALPPQNRCTTKGSTFVYSRECGWILVVRVQ